MNIWKIIVACLCFFISDAKAATLEEFKEVIAADALIDDMSTVQTGDCAQVLRHIEEMCKQESSEKVLQTNEKVADDLERVIKRNAARLSEIESAHGADHMKKEGWAKRIVDVIDSYERVRNVGLAPSPHILPHDGELDHIRVTARSYCQS